MLTEWSEFDEKIHNHYIGLISAYQAERREILKYVAVIAGGAAALAPQVLEYVNNTVMFYISISLLCLVVIISVIHILSTVENDTTKLTDDFLAKNKLIYLVRKPIIEFFNNGDYSNAAFMKAVTESHKHIPNTDREPPKEKGWYIPLDYTGEFVIWFTVTGLAMLALSLVGDMHVNWKWLLLADLGIFILINIISTYPNHVFVVLGFPIDLIKSSKRIFKKLKRYEVKN